MRTHDFVSDGFLALIVTALVLLCSGWLIIAHWLSLLLACQEHGPALCGNGQRAGTVPGHGSVCGRDPDKPNTGPSDCSCDSKNQRLFFLHPRNPVASRQLCEPGPEVLRGSGTVPRPMVDNRA
jgi:hypothetical protein